MTHTSKLFQIQIQTETALGDNGKNHILNFRLNILTENYTIMEFRWPLYSFQETTKILKRGEEGGKKVVESLELKGSINSDFSNGKIDVSTPSLLL